MDGHTTTVSLVETVDSAPARSLSTKKKRSLPNLLLPTRRKSIRSLKSHPSPPQTAAVGQSFASKSASASPTPDSNDESIPPVPQRKPSVIQSRIVEARKKRDEEFKNVVDVAKVTAQPSNSGALPFSDLHSRPSLSQSRGLRIGPNNEPLLSRPQDIVTSRPSVDNQYRPLHTANFSKPNPIFPTQNELESFDFRLPQRPHTANLSPVSSPKHESVPTIPKGIRRPRQVSDAESSWTRSPKLSDHEWTPPWTAMYARDQRGSNGSGFTTGSSTLDTVRSSVFTTKGSDGSETTDDLDEADQADDYADDILDMYFGGKDESLQSIKESADDQENAHAKRQSTLSAQAIDYTADDEENARTKRKSMMIALAMESAADDRESVHTKGHSTIKPQEKEQVADDRESAHSKLDLTLTVPASEPLLVDPASLQSSQQPGSSLSTSGIATPHETEVRLDQQPEHRPPKLQVRSTEHDQYGFRKKTRDISLKEYNLWWKEYCPTQKHRTNRWKEFMKGEGLSTDDPRVFPEPSSKVRRFIQKGIPPAWRGNAWFFYAGGHEYLAQFPGHYQNLLRRAQEGELSEVDQEAIERDLHRSFPDNIHFKPNQDAPNTDPKLNGTENYEESSIMAALRRVLSAFALDHPKIGYCQSLNFVAGMLLLFLPEERVYWLVHIITTEMFPGTHDTSLEGTNVDLWVLMCALRDNMASAWNVIGPAPRNDNPNGPQGRWDPSYRILPAVSMPTTTWLMSLFVGTLPTESLLRVWDLLFYDGAKTVFRVSVAIFKSVEHVIKVSDPMDTPQIVQQAPRKMIRCGDLIAKTTAGGKVGISTAWLEKQRKIKRAMYVKERAEEAERKNSKTPRKPGEASQKQSEAAGANDDSRTTPASTKAPKLERLPTRKASGWFAKRTQTVRKVTNPAA